MLLPFYANEWIFMFYLLIIKKEGEPVDTYIKDGNINLNNLGIDDGLDKCSMGSSCVSPVSSQGGIYSVFT